MWQSLLPQCRQDHSDWEPSLCLRDARTRARSSSRFEARCGSEKWGHYFFRLRMYWTRAQRSLSARCRQAGMAPRPLVIFQKRAPSVSDWTSFEVQSAGLGLSASAAGPLPVPVTPWHDTQLACATFLPWSTALRLAAIGLFLPASDAGAAHRPWAPAPTTTTASVSPAATTIMRVPRVRITGSLCSFQLVPTGPMSTRHQRLEDSRLLGPGHFQRAERALLHGPHDAVIDEQESPRHLHLQFDDRRTARRHQRGLDVAHRCAAPQRGLGVDGVEDLADRVEGGDQVRPAIADVEPHRFTHLGLDRALAQERPHLAVEHHVLRPLGGQLGWVERLEAGCQRLPPCVELALHDVVLA